MQLFSSKPNFHFQTPSPNNFLPLLFSSSFTPVKWFPFPTPPTQQFWYQLPSNLERTVDSFLNRRNKGKNTIGIEKRRNTIDIEKKMLQVLQRAKASKKKEQLEVTTLEIEKELPYLKEVFSRKRRRLHVNKKNAKIELWISKKSWFWSGNVVNMPLNIRIETK